MKQIFLFLIFGLFLGSSLISALSINFIEPTPENNSTINTNFIPINVYSSSETLNNISTFIDFDNSIISWWRMDDLNSSGDVVDYTGNHNGIISGATQTQGYLGKSFEFDGSNDYIAIGSGWFPTGDITISAWIYARSWGEGNKGRILASRDGQRFYLDGDVGDQRLTFSSDDGISKAHSGNFSSYLNKWTHIVVMRRGHLIYFYINGVKSDAEDSIGGVPLSGRDVYIGSNYGLDKSFDGYIDDLIIFNRLLSEEEIQGLYANTPSKYLEHNFLELSEGAYDFKAYTQDMSGEVMETEQRSLTIQLFGTEISECRALGVPNTHYTLIADIVDNTLNNNQPCIAITAPNVTLDCQGYYITSTNDADNIGIYSNQPETIIKNCKINMGEESIGIELFNANNSLIFNNTLDNQANGLFLTNVHNAKIEENTLNSNSESGIRLDYSSNNFLLRNNLNSNYEKGIYLYNSINNILTGNLLNLNGNGITAIDSYGNELRDSNFSSSRYYDIKLTSILIPTNINLLNSIYNPDKENIGLSSQLFRKWYYQAHVTNNGANVAGASVKLYNQYGTLVLDLTTDSNGIAQGNIIDYVNNAGTKTYYSPYSVKTVSGALNETHSLTVSTALVNGHINEEIHLINPSNPSNSTICSDSDNGVNYLTKGTVYVDGKRKRTDACVEVRNGKYYETRASNLLYEYYCKDSRTGWGLEFHNCECKNGACVSP